MMQMLDRWLSLGTLAWLLPVTFLIHDGEEILTVAGWSARHRATLLHRFRRFAFVRRMVAETDMSTAQFAAAVGCVLVFVLSGNLGYGLGGRYGLFWFAAVVGAMFGNVLTHTGQSLILGRYTPGVVSAWVVLLPYTLYTFHRLLAAGLVTVGELFLAGLAGGVVIMALLRPIFAVARFLVPRA